MGMDDLCAVFDMVNAIKAIVRCESSMVLKSLKKVIDDRMGELGALSLKDERIEEMGQMPVKLGQTPTEKGQISRKIEQKPPFVEQTIEKTEKKAEEQIKKPDDVWTRADDALIREHYPNMSALDIVEKYLPSRSEQAVYDRAYSLGIKKISRHANEGALEEPEQEEKKQRGHHQLFSSDLILDHRGTLSIYKPVVDIILEKTSDTFSLFDASKIILSFFLTKGRVITEKSAIKYSYSYLHYMESKEMIVVDKKGSYKKLEKDEFEEVKVKNGIYIVSEEQKNKKILERRSFEDNISDSDAVGVDDGE